MLKEQLTVATITEKAAQKVKEFIIRESKGENKVNSGLRVYVAGGGCSGLTYGMALEATASDDDIIVEDYGVKLYIDPFSLKYLQGSTVDYVESLMGSGFKIENPNVVSSCACGQSFHTG